MRSSLAVVRETLLVVCAYTLLFCWVFASPLLNGRYMIEGDLYDWFLPIFLSSQSPWSHDLFAGLPLFADTSDSQWYFVHYVFAHLAQSWTGYIIAAYVIAACSMYAYVLGVTGSRLAAILAGLAFSLSHTMMERQAHINIVHASAWLPLIALAIDRILTGASRRWIAIGAMAIASCFLAGHPQPIFYAVVFCAIYAVVGARAERVSSTIVKRLAATLLLGMLLTSVKALPFLEVSRYMARTEVTYEWFITPAQSPVQLLGGLFIPSMPAGESAPVYLGVSILALAILGVLARSFRWRALTWAAAVLFAVLVTAGSATPVAWLAYQLPLFDKFRIASRMLFVGAAGVSVLAAFGVSALASQTSPTRHFVVSAVTVAAGLVIAIALFVVTGEGASYRAGLAAGAWRGLLAFQITIVIATTSALLLVRWGVLRLSGLIALITIVTVDLISNISYPVTARGLQVTTMESELTRPSVHARALKTAVDATHQRVLAVGGTSRDPIVPAGFARTWHIPTAGGFSPVMLDRLASLALMGGAGDIFPEALAFEDRSLDLLSVRYLIVRAADYPAVPTFNRQGLAWAEPRLEFSIGRSDCAPQYPRALSLQFPEDLTVTSLALVGYLRCAEELPHEMTVATIDVRSAAGDMIQRPLRVGIDTAERYLNDPRTRDRAQHRPPALFPDPELSQAYLARVDLPAPQRGARLSIRTAPIRGWATIERLTVVDDHGKAHPQTLGPLFLTNSARWREVMRVRTSRLTDRISDETSPLEEELVIYENRRVLPRAWVAHDVVELPPAEAIETVRYSQMPDGRPFAPEDTLLVDPGSGVRAVPPGRWSADITTLTDTAVTIRVSTAYGGHLVFSEAWYPGWRARVDGRETALRRVNVMFQGVEVPPGDHTVVFTLESATLRSGTVASLLATVFAAWLLWRG